jgi:hypothetical protein
MKDREIDSKRARKQEKEKERVSYNLINELI